MILNTIGLLNRRYFMRSIAALFFGLWALSIPAGAQETDIVHAKPALWTVQKGDNTTYFLGSFHLLPKNYQWYEGIIQSSFEAADELVMETELTPEATAKIQGLLIKNGFFAGEDNLKNHLDADRYAKMLTYAKKLMGQEEVAAQKMKPWFMAMNLSILTIMSNGMDPNSGVDKYLEGLAKQSEIAITGLETASDQMMALIDHPLNVQAAMLSETLDQLDDFQAVMDNYLTAWASGDSDRISKTMVDDMKKYQGIYEALLVNRNANWIPAIEGHINSAKTVFVVVGAAHLAGPDSVLNMLEDKGYKVNKIQ
ncbi:MAG: TraB/GumN family protein [Emcibacter sp.]|nr:TraB/GumN family protein [Emcibacter sp.]